jgi:hypothetical protein
MRQRRSPCATHQPSSWQYPEDSNGRGRHARSPNARQRVERNRRADEAFVAGVPARTRVTTDRSEVRERNAVRQRHLRPERLESPRTDPRSRPASAAAQPRAAARIPTIVSPGRRRRMPALRLHHGLDAQVPFSAIPTSATGAATPDTIDSVSASPRRRRTRNA